MTPTAPVQDLAAQWSCARRLYPIYFELAREFAMDVKVCADLETGADTPGKEAIEQANRWLDELDQLVQVHQLRQFLQTSALITQDALVSLLQHFLAKSTKTDMIRDKVDFLLVQYFSQLAPAGVSDAEVDLAFVAKALEPVLGEVELKPPVWLNALDRVLEAARRCRTLDDLLHGGVLEQGRKAKSLAGDLFYLPVALTAFTRFGYLMRRAFFRLMLGDLNTILDGLTELEEKGVETIDCRRAQFSAQEPIVRLRVICQSWKVMFQAEYSSGSPLRMLVDLRASVEYALGRGKEAEAKAKSALPAQAAPAAKAASPAPSAAPAKPAVAAKPVGEVKPPMAKAVPPVKPAPPLKSAATPEVAKPEPATKPAAMAASAGASKSATKSVAGPPAEAPEFEVSSTPGWDADSDATPENK
jgi:hypothetical protein